MNLSDTFAAIWRRWYIALPGLLVAVVVAGFVFLHSPVNYQRQATLLLLPAEMSIPEGGNPYLYIGGLSQTADVLVRAVGADSVLDEVKQAHPGVDVTVTRDASTGSPLLLLTTTSADDEAAAAALSEVLSRAQAELASLQQAEGIASNNQITAVTLTVDTKGIASQRSRLMGTAVSGVAVALLTVLAVALVEGLAGGRQRRRSGAATPATAPGPSSLRVPAPATGHETVFPGDDELARLPREAARQVRGPGGK